MRFFCLNLAIKAVLIPKISGGTFWQDLNLSNLVASHSRQGVADKLLFIMAITPRLLGLCALTQAFINHDLTQLT
jgi:hypothetical protein